MVKRNIARFGMLSLGVVAGLLPGCSDDKFRCSNDEECTVDSVRGFCETNGYCSFPSADCDSQRRYGEHAGGGLAGQCVPEVDNGSGTNAATTGSSPSTTDADPSTSSSTTEADDTTGTTTGTTSSDSSDATGSDDSGSTTGNPSIDWSDDFDRPDSPSLGNGWIERSPGAFGLVQGRVVFEGLGASYQDSVFYRPFEEAVLDLETSIEFIQLDVFDFSTPQLHARIQEESLGPVTESINAYIVYLSQPDAIDISRIEGDSFARSATAPIDPPLVVDETYRLTLRVTGTDPVELVGRVEGLVDGAWTPIQTVLLTDSDETRITEPGSFGASGSNTITFVYDNFTVVAP